MCNRVLILEDHAGRVAGFEQAVGKLEGDLTVKVWRDAHSMLAECAAYLDEACLISLDHDLIAERGQPDPGDGVEVATYLASFPPACPVIVHSTNHERVHSMLNELRFAKWENCRVGHMGDDWIEKDWLPLAREFIAKGRDYPPIYHHPLDHAVRMERARLALDGLSLGDAFGECFFAPQEVIEERLAERKLPPDPWHVTDDTIMAISVVETLDRFGEIRGDQLAQAFGKRYDADPYRGYGGTAHSILRQLHQGVSWRKVAAAVFDGSGSKGNGAAMRVAPLGAYFAEDDDERIIEQAARSAEVTHAHPDGIAGAIAVALATAWVYRLQGQCPDDPFDLIRFCVELTPDGPTRSGLLRALGVPLQSSARHAANVLGSGKGVVSEDTVPYVLWCVARHLECKFAEAMWETVSELGDRDTTCAMVGGILVLHFGVGCLPDLWTVRREALPFL